MSDSSQPITRLRFSCTVPSAESTLCARSSDNSRETPMPDLEITCAECGTSFPFTEREQDYYRERGLTHPKRCKPCREARRADFGRRRQGGGGGGGEREHFEIVGDQGGKSHSVPFK